jgi:hypothetical protein
MPQRNATYIAWLQPPAQASLVEMGTMTIAPTGIWTFQTPGFTMNPGDMLVITAPDPMDPLLSDVALSIVFTRIS